jgi:hypothetical protein
MSPKVDMNVVSMGVNAVKTGVETVKTGVKTGVLTPPENRC